MSLGAPALAPLSISSARLQKSRHRIPDRQTVISVLVLKGLHHEYGFVAHAA
jgi:hypothetical protein